jgi:hypothetical protein
VALRRFSEERRLHTANLRHECYRREQDGQRHVAQCCA